MSCSHVNQDNFEAQGWCPRERRVTDCVFTTCTCHEPAGVCLECDGDPDGTAEVTYRTPDDLAAYAEEQAEKAALAPSRVAVAVGLGVELITMARDIDDTALIERVVHLSQADLGRVVVFMANTCAMLLDPDEVTTLALVAART